ncbi:MAG: hypothetical protein HYY84_00980 [Deltaproteobacteria bacterium]|nr:hypothetical protein [Deltaproteobacteria bacterium]
MSTNLNKYVAIAFAGIGAACSGQTVPSTGEATSTVQLGLSKSSICPFPGGLQGFFWWIQPHGSKNIVPVGVSLADIEAFCSGARGYLKRVHLAPGDYEIIAQAKDANRNVVNDVEASYDAFTVGAGASTPVFKSFVPASQPRSYGDSPTGGAEAMFDATGDDALVCGTTPMMADGCCCPSSCKGESVVGCSRAVRNGVCTGWTNPCGC